MEIEKTSYNGWKEISSNKNGVIVEKGNRGRFYTHKEWEDIKKEGIKESKNMWNSYFDHNFGVVIDSPEKLRQIEKENKGQYYSVDEFMNINKNKQKEKQQMDFKDTRNKLEGMYIDLKRGRSFTQELKRRGLL